jgi:signal transduction histidine kinase/CheY-like chemotaxis protein
LIAAWAWPGRPIQKVLGTGSLVIAAILAVAIAVAINRYQTELADAGRELRMLDMLLAEETGRSLQSVELVLKSVVDQVNEDRVTRPEAFAARESSLAMHEFLRARVAGIQQLNAITMIGGQGKLINFSRSWPIPDVDLSDRDYFRYLRDHPTDAPFLTEPVINRGSGTRTIYLAKRIRGQDGVFLGLVLGAIELNYFENFYRSLKLQPGNFVALWRQDGVLLARYPPADIGLRVSPELVVPPLLSSAWHGVESVFETTLALDGTTTEPRIIASQPVGGYPVLVNLGRSKALILTDWRREVIYVGAAISLAVLCVIVVMWALIRRFHAYEAVEAASREREKAILARQEVEHALRHSQKMEAIGQLTGGVAHDFNNLLTVIRSAIDLLRRPDLSEERRRRYIEAISDTASRGAKLTGQLLAFARRQVLKPEVFDVVENIRGISDMVGTLTGPRIHVETHVPDAPLFINADSSQFDTSIVNMAVNARDAMAGEGRLIITVATVDALPPALRAQSEAPGPFVAVSVTDTGSGIASGMIDRIFEPFFTTKDVGKGTGLGLSQVFGFARQSGGQVMVESEVGRGTTFTLYLPRVSAETRPVVETSGAEEASGRGTCVLVVEDNADVGALAIQTLAELGYETVWAISAESALVELEKNAQRFGVVFSDVVMPGMNGIDLGREIRRRHVDLPVVLTSGYSQMLAQNGTYGFELLQKPYSVDQLSGVLRKVARGRERRRMLAE